VWHHLVAQKKVEHDCTTITLLVYKTVKNLFLNSENSTACPFEFLTSTIHFLEPSVQT